MKRLFAIMMVFIVLQPAFAPLRLVAAQAPKSPAALCLPGIYLSDPKDCIPAGPAGYLTDMASKGLALPILPLSYTPIDPALSNIDIHYGEVHNMPAPIYGSVEDAVKASKKAALQRLDGNFVFVSYTSEQESGGKHLYEVGSGQWMTAAYISRLNVLPPSRGITFSQTPLNPFGWVLTYFTENAQVQTKRTPGKQNNDYTGHILNLYDIVSVYGEQMVDKDNWYLIGPDEWVPAKLIARVIPNPVPPKGVNGDRWIEVNLAAQTLAVYDKRQMVFATVIASGAEPFWTQPGVFKIYEKHEATPMRGAMSGGGDAYYLEDVPWTMYYDGPRALHGAYWRAKMGYEQSHGCVNLTVGDAHWLFNWGQLGDQVYVWDPSGKTPTDPKLYNSGGF
jgi:hypothetical protein